LKEWDLNGAESVEQEGFDARVTRKKRGKREKKEEHFPKDNYKRLGQGGTVVKKAEHS